MAHEQHSTTLTDHLAHVLQVKSVDPDNNRAVVTLTLTGQTANLSQHALCLVYKAEFKTYSKYLSELAACSIHGPPELQLLM